MTDKTMDHWDSSDIARHVLRETVTHYAPDPSEAHAAGEAGIAALRGAPLDCCGAPRLSGLDAPDTCPAAFGMRARLEVKRQTSAHGWLLAFIGAGFLIAGLGLLLTLNFTPIALCAAC